MSILFSDVVSGTFEGVHGEGMVGDDRGGKSGEVKHLDTPVSLKIAAVACLSFCCLSDQRSSLLPVS